MRHDARHDASEPQGNHHQTKSQQSGCFNQGRDPR
jgi:hypothetical protein